MEYVGAADYFFWQGVEKGLNASPSKIEKLSQEKVFFGKNDVTVACLEAYTWGLYLGSELSKQEYIDLTTKTYPDKIKREKVIEEDEIINTTNVVGNC